MILALDDSGTPCYVVGFVQGTTSAKGSSVKAVCVYASGGVRAHPLDEIEVTDPVIVNQLRFVTTHSARGNTEGK